jgi:putative copper resistance protein D
VTDDAVLIAARFVHFAALAWLVGGSLYRLGVGISGVAGTGARRDAIWGDAIAAATAFVSGMVWFFAVAAEMGEGWRDVLDPGIVTAVASETQFGRLWTARLLVLAILAALVPGRLRRPVAGEAVLFALSAMAAASLAFTGHGMAEASDAAEIPAQGGRWIHTAAYALHALCGLGWIGAVAALIFAAWGKRTTDDARLAAVLRRFSRIGYVLVTLLVASGIAITSRLVPDLSAIADSGYGRVLLVKIGLVLLMLAFAACNRLVFTPRIAADDRGAAARLRQSAVAELAIGLAVLSAVAILGTIHPHA